MRRLVDLLGNVIGYWVLGIGIGYWNLVLNKRFWQ